MIYQKLSDYAKDLKNNDLPDEIKFDIHFDFFDYDLGILIGDTTRHGGDKVKRIYEVIRLQWVGLWDDLNKEWKKVSQGQ